MGFRRRNSSTPDRKTVVCRDPDTGKSIQFTVYTGGSLSAFARQVQALADRRWRTTSVTDRRHKARSPYA